MVLLMGLSTPCEAQFFKKLFKKLGLSKKKKVVVKAISDDVYFLSSDEMEGRRMGTTGEKKAADYISQRFADKNLAPYKGKYIHEFKSEDKSKLSDKHYIEFFGKQLKNKSDYLIPICSGSGLMNAQVIMGMQEPENLWVIKFSEVGVELNNALGNGGDLIHQKAKQAIDAGAEAVMFVNDVGVQEDFSAINKIPKTKLEKPMWIVNHAAYNKFLAPHDVKDWLYVSYNVSWGNSKRLGRNVIGIIDNRAMKTVIIGAHYDHLGFGEDNNSLHQGFKAVHNGADDNASGVAAMIELIPVIRNNQLRNYNYIFIAFSGQELGRLGSEKFLEDSRLDSFEINYMFNLEMLGRLNAQNDLELAGIGTSPEWGGLLRSSKHSFRFKLDSSGGGSGDQSSFYQKHIPVLSFSTGKHSDYHRPTDDANKINTSGIQTISNWIATLIVQLDSKGKLEFAKTKAKKIKVIPKMSFEVSLGVIPDYTYEGDGLKIKEITQGRAAQIAGVKMGDVLVRMGPYDIKTLEDYIEQMSKYKKGDRTEITIRRVDDKMTLPLQFD